MNDRTFPKTSQFCFKVTVAHLENFRTPLNVFRNHQMTKNILRSSTKNCGTLRASHEDENLDKLTPLQYLNVKLKHSVFFLKNDV